MAIFNGKRNFLYKVLPMDIYLKVIYRKFHKHRLNLKNPETFSEKLFWLKKYNMNENKNLIVKCYDKYNVRDYVEKEVGSKYLTNIYGVFNNADEIDFSTLPKEYVLKISQSCGCNIIRNHNCKLTNEEIRCTLTKWKREQDNLEKIRNESREEGFYFDGNTSIICEEYLEDSNGKVPDDIRFFCFNGIPKFYCIDFDTVDEEGVKRHDFFYRNVYGLDGTFIPVELGRPNNEMLEAPKFINFDEMVEVASKLSKDFPFVRVDLYNVEGRIVFGELTWMPQGGNIPIRPYKYDYEFGQYLKLPIERENII